VFYRMLPKMPMTRLAARVNGHTMEGTMCWASSVFLSHSLNLWPPHTTHAETCYHRTVWTT
jgi:hypothetical protein